MSLLSNVPSKSADESDVPPENLDDIPPESSDEEGWTGRTYRQPNLDDEYERHMYDLLENSASRQVLRRALAVIGDTSKGTAGSLTGASGEFLGRIILFQTAPKPVDLINYIIQTLKPRFQAELADLQAAHAALVDSDSDSDASTVVSLRKNQEHDHARKTTRGRTGTRVKRRVLISDL